MQKLSNFPKILATNSFLKNVKSSLEVLSHIAIIAGILFSGLEYVNLKRSQKQLTTVSYLLKFFEYDVSKTRMRLQKNWFNTPLRHLNGIPGSSETIDKMALAIIFSNPTNSALEDLVFVVEQLDVIGVCVQNEICESELTKKQMSNITESVHCLYSSPLKKLRTEFGYQNLGVASKYLLEGYQSC